MKVKSKISKQKIKPKLGKRKMKPGPSKVKILAKSGAAKINQKKKFKKKLIQKSEIDSNSISIDDFKNQHISDSDGEQQVNKLSNTKQKMKANKKLKVKSKNKLIRSNGKSKDIDNEESSDNENLNGNFESMLQGSDEEDLEEEASNAYENEIVSHKKSLEKLKNTDPEFYKFLQDNDKKLLNFDISDDDDDDKEDDYQEEKIHQPGELEIASDESDFEADDHVEGEDSGRSIVITLKMLKNWQAALPVDKTNKTINCVVHAFHAALLQVANTENEVARYKVDGSSVFNAVIQLCVLELSPAIRRFLGLTSSKMVPHKCKKFVKVKSLLRGYFTDLLKLLGSVTSTNILRVLLKHLHHMSPLFVSFPNIAKPMVKKLIHLWGTADEVVRVLAFFCILRITNNQLGSLLDTVLKSMYMTYIINSKFVSVNSLSSINFMRRSLVEMFALDPAVSYQHVFLYIRQLAIHLRNATLNKKKENIQTVYNWQFMNSLKLWGNLLSATSDKSELQPLIYPFVQVCLGALKLVPAAQYYPLRFHIVEVLIDFSRDTGVFIPILPFILEVLNTFDFNKKHKKVSMKPMNFTCILRLSDSQMSENGFKDSAIDNIYALLLKYLASQSHSLAFPDLSLFCIFQLKQFISKCSVSNYNRKMKQILEKINQNNEFLEKERKTISFNLTDGDKIQAWETGVKNKGTPISTFYESWDKLRTIKKNKEATNNEQLGDYNLPVIKRAKKDEGEKGQKKPADPFPSDTDSDGEINFGSKDEEKPKKKRNKKRKKTTQSEIKEDVVLDDGGQQDTVEDLNISDW